MSDAYNEHQRKILDLVEGKHLEVLEQFDTSKMDKDDIDNFIKLTKAITDNIHKEASVASKHDIGTSLVETAEDRQAFLRELHASGKTVKEELPSNFIDAEIEDRLLPEPVPGQLLDGIEKPTLKAIMDTPEEDEDE